MSNSQKMSLEERLVQYLKDEKLTILMDDEVAVTDLVKRAIHESLFKNRVVSNGHYSTKEEEPLVVSTAREIAKEAISKLMQQEIDKLLADPEVSKEIQKVIIALLPMAVVEHSKNSYYNYANMVGTNAVQEIRMLLTRKGIQLDHTN